MRCAEFYFAIQLNWTITLVGHHTVANCTSRILYELALRAELQARVRAGMLGMTSMAQARGDGDITASDFGNKPYTAAVMKVQFVLRYAESTGMCL
jgi:cytochrome P450